MVLTAEPSLANVCHTYSTLDATLGQRKYGKGLTCTFQVVEQTTLL
jgi:hypothetical protein